MYTNFLNNTANKEIFCIVEMIFFVEINNTNSEIKDLKERIFKII